MSYTRDMIDVARTWLRVNPDPKSPFVKVPGLDKNGGQRRAADALMPARLRRYERLAAERPEIKADVDLIKRKLSEMKELRADLNDHEAVFETAVNTLAPRHQKYEAAEQSVNGDVAIGRWCLAWARSGYNTFDLSPDFVSAVLLTDARSLDVDLVRLPFPAILITIPGGFAVGAEGRSYTKIHVTEIPADDLRMLHAADQISHAIDDLPPDEKRAFLEQLKADRAPPPLLQQAAATRSLVGPSRLLRQSASAGSLHIYATDGEHVLDTLIDREGLTWAAFDDLPDQVTADSDRQARHTLRQIVFGALAYANAVDRAIESRFPGAPRKKHDAGPHAAQWTIGRTVKIDPRLVQVAQSGSREAQFRLKPRFIVRGHYRNQAHGPQRSLRTSKWIAPFWKGPEGGAEIVHTYKLDDEGGGTP